MFLVFGTAHSVVNLAISCMDRRVLECIPLKHAKTGHPKNGTLRALLSDIDIIYIYKYLIIYQTLFVYSCKNSTLRPSRFHSGSDNSPGAGWNPVLAGDEYLNLGTANYPQFICMD